MISRMSLVKMDEVYLNKDKEFFVVTDDSEVAYRFTKQNISWEKVKRDYSWKVWCKTISGEMASEIMMGWVKEQFVNKHRLNTAIEFATQKHKGQFRKSTAIPYILHPLEVLQILYSMRADSDLLIAGVLHDTVEDTDTTLDEIREVFGDDVAYLVASNSEDKSKTWQERKQHTITEVANADLRVKALVLADKLSNMRSIAIDYKSIGDKLWDRFNAPKEKQAWYYGSVQDSLWDMQDYPETEDAYWEFVGLFKDVFVEYYLDEENDIIFQRCNDGEIYVLQKGNPQWRNLNIDTTISCDIEKNCDEKRRFYNVSPIPENAVQITRKEAELTEDIWNKSHCVAN